MVRILRTDAVDLGHVRLTIPGVWLKNICCTGVVCTFSVYREVGVTPKPSSETFIAVFCRLKLVCLFDADKDTCTRAC
ncbi:Hypp5500 [Branchiostoma lanceolatum]|uniref:Hypp5500 protein n=1 Tax=Branchiostoma lanceolatum TaxID=7740 RepID=A0A8J9YR03_BRALA|nr:Hypp5500 [Branchiostoma lanceolatum]